MNIQFKKRWLIDEIIVKNKIKSLTIKNPYANIILTKEKHLIKEEHQN